MLRTCSMQCCQSATECARSPRWRLFLAPVLLALCFVALLLRGHKSSPLVFSLRTWGGQTTADVMSCESRPRPSWPVKEDLVIAMPSDEAHIPLVLASRPWRKGIRTVIAVNDEALASMQQGNGSAWNETWVHYPDDSELRGNYPGDTRAALVPFLAHKAIGESYKWLLYGDDDTNWFVEGALKLAGRLHHDMPYFVTDNLWWGSENGSFGFQPNLEAPRCLPCNYTLQYPKPAGEMAFNAPDGCPCTPALLCAADQRQVFDKDCHIPRANVPAFSQRTYSVHGGAGGLLSIGLLRAVSVEAMSDCIQQAGHTTGGDTFITICLWQLGYAHSDPGPWFNEADMRLFDAARWLSSFDLAQQLSNAAGGHCEVNNCQELLRSIVSKHIKSRDMGSFEEAANSMTQLSRAYSDFVASPAWAASNVAPC